MVRIKYTSFAALMGTSEVHPVLVSIGPPRTLRRTYACRPLVSSICI